MARLLFYLMEAPRTRLLGLAALQYTPSLLEVEVDLRVIVEEPFGNLLDVECIVVRVLHLQRGRKAGTRVRMPARKHLAERHVESIEVIVLKMSPRELGRFRVTSACRTTDFPSLDRCQEASLGVN
jgi:hypothetical protein